MPGGDGEHEGGCKVIEPLHIGDGVYAICEAHDDGTLLLRTGSHESDNCNDSIILEPPVIDALIKYIKRMREDGGGPVESGFDLPMLTTAEEWKDAKTASLTTSEALDILHAKAPTWSFSAQKQSWLHGGTVRTESYTVSAHEPPSGCENFYGETLQSAVDQCIAKLFPEPENNLE